MSGLKKQVVDLDVAKTTPEDVAAIIRAALPTEPELPKDDLKEIADWINSNRGIDSVGHVYMRENQDIRDAVQKLRKWLDSDDTANCMYQLERNVIDLGLDTISKFMDRAYFRANPRKPAEYAEAMAWEMACRVCPENKRGKQKDSPAVIIAAAFAQRMGFTGSNARSVVTTLERERLKGDGP